MRAFMEGYYQALFLEKNAIEKYLEKISFRLGAPLAPALPPMGTGALRMPLHYLNENTQTRGGFLKGT